MLQVTSAFKGCSLEVSDGVIGAVEDFLFDDRSWRMRWLVIDTGSWLPGRKVLLHPSAIRRSDPDERVVRVDLTKAQVEESPGIRTDQPVSRQVENSLHGYYGWDPCWDIGIMGGGGLSFSPVMADRFGESMLREPPVSDQPFDDGDPHLRSTAAVTGYHVHAVDGGIGHVEDFLVDATDWGIRYLIVNTRNWWIGRQVLVSPYAITKIEWLERQIRLDISRDQVKTSEPWTPSDYIDRAYEEQLHKHYGWPGYGW